MLASTFVSWVQPALGNEVLESGHELELEVGMAHAQRTGMDIVRVVGKVAAAHLERDGDGAWHERAVVSWSLDSADVAIRSPQEPVYIYRERSSRGDVRATRIGHGKPTSTAPLRPSSQAKRPTAIELLVKSLREQPWPEAVRYANVSSVQECAADEPHGPSLSTSSASRAYDDKFSIVGFMFEMAR